MGGHILQKENCPKANKNVRAIKSKSSKISFFKRLRSVFYGIKVEISKKN